MEAGSASDSFQGRTRRSAAFLLQARSTAGASAIHDQCERRPRHFGLPLVTRSPMNRATQESDQACNGSQIPDERSLGDDRRQHRGCQQHRRGDKKTADDVHTRSSAGTRRGYWTDGESAGHRQDCQCLCWSDPDAATAAPVVCNVSARNTACGAPQCAAS